jgi:hypothetical protein
MSTLKLLTWPGGGVLDRDAANLEAEGRGELEGIGEDGKDDVHTEIVSSTSVVSFVSITGCAGATGATGTAGAAADIDGNMKKE